MIQKLYQKNNSPRDVERVVKVLNDGGVVVLPTDTRYALACHALKERAIERICELKHLDPKKNHLSIVANNLSMLSDYVKMDNDTFKLVKRHTPGPFAFILETSNRLPKIFKNRKEVGIRIPDNPIVRDICAQLDAPLLTSTLPLNDNDENEYLTNPELIAERWEELVDLMVDGGYGESEGATIVDCTGEKPEILRQGKGGFIN
ncbi:MAG: L-threonylcarbamoyladenylate synthase [Bacteroidales bacterium]|nr:L-threonylcarbamoyladenylate synthase [Bacteroidales bacterium]